MTNQDLIKELLNYPMDAEINIGIKNMNQIEPIVINYGDCEDGTDLDVTSDMEEHGGHVFIRAWLKTEDF